LKLVYGVLRSFADGAVHFAEQGVKRGSVHERFLDDE